MGKGAIEDSTLIALLPDYLSESFIGHAIVGQKCDILRARVRLLIHKSMCVDEMCGVEMQKLSQSIHMMHEQPHVCFALHHECFKESHFLTLSLADSHPSQQT